MAFILDAIDLWISIITCSWILWIMKFYLFDLDHYQMILVLKLDLDIVKMYVCPENEVPSFSSSKVMA